MLRVILIRYIWYKFASEQCRTIKLQKFWTPTSTIMLKSLQNITNKLRQFMHHSARARTSRVISHTSSYRVGRRTRRPCWGSFQTWGTGRGAPPGTAPAPAAPSSRSPGLPRRSTTRWAPPLMSLAGQTGCSCSAPTIANEEVNVTSAARQWHQHKKHKWCLITYYENLTIYSIHKIKCS